MFKAIRRLTPPSIIRLTLTSPNWYKKVHFFSSYLALSNASIRDLLSISAANSIPFHSSDQLRDGVALCDLENPSKYTLPNLEGMNDRSKISKV